MKLPLNDVVGALCKAGARHGKGDKQSVQDAHDALAKLVDGSHCMKADEGEEETPPKQEDDEGYGEMGENVGKRGARHSKEDLERIQKAHDLVVELGAMCPGGDDEEKDD